ISRWRILRAIRAEHFDVAICPMASRTFEADAIVHAAGAPERIGCAGLPGNILPAVGRRTDRWYTRLVGRPPAGLSELENNALAARQLGLGELPAQPAHIEAMPDRLAPELRAAAENGPVFIICPGGSIPGKCWPVERFAQVARHIHRRTGWRLLICGSSG